MRPRVFVCEVVGTLVCLLSADFRQNSYLDMTSASSRDALRQLDQFWSMLDNLSENDPAAYSSFINKQMKEGADYNSPPEIHTSLRTEILGPRRGFLYINVCSWKRVPAPQDPSRPLPVFAGKLETETKEGQDCSTVLEIALNPTALEENNKGDKEVCMLALNFARQQYGLRLSEEYIVVSCCPKSSQSDLHQRLGYQQWPNVPREPNTDRAGRPCVLSQTPATLLEQISSLQSESQDEDAEAQMICRPTENKSKGLIQVISTTYTQPREPEYQLEVKADEAGASRCVKLTVELPEVCSMSDCQLRISKDDILLEVEDRYYLLLKLPESVNEDSAAAVFNKKKQRLTLTVGVL